MPEVRVKISACRRLTTILGLAVFVLALSLPAQAISRVKQSGMPADLSVSDAAILEENESFITLMSEHTVRSIARQRAEIVSRDASGDKAFIKQNRGQNADYWYWAHQKARQALILALGNQPGPAADAIKTIPYTEFLAPQYEWIATPEFSKYLETAGQDPAYLQDPYLGVEVFLTNYQVSRLEREYPNTKQRGKVVRPKIPVLEISLRELVSTPRKGEEEKVGLDAQLGLPGGGIYESLLPSSKEYKNRPNRIPDRLVTAGDANLKTIPVSCREAKELIERYMSADKPYDRFLQIEGSMRASDDGTRFSDDLKIMVNEKSSMAQSQKIHREVFAGVNFKKAQ